MNNIEILIGFELLQELIPVDNKVGFLCFGLMLCWLIRKSREPNKVRKDR